MAQYNGKPAGTVNAFMKEYLPETAGCTYADFPMSHARWLQPKEKTPDGGMACFIKTGDELPAEGMKQGYVWGPGPFGFGYYHLLTKPAHATLYSRILNRRVFLGPNVGGGGVGCCGCFGGEPDPRAQMPKGVKADDIDDLRRLFHARSVATVPNDGVAAQDALGEARATAQAHYHFDQNIQLGMHVANAAIVR